MTWKAYEGPRLSEAGEAVREAFVLAAEEQAEIAAESVRADLHEIEENVLEKDGKLYYAFTEDALVARVKDAVLDAMTPEPGYCLPV